MEITTIDPILEQYLAEVRRYTTELDSHPENNQAILDLIQEHFDHSEDHSEFALFLLGEQSFYSKQYEQALKYYLQAKTIPDFEFFCFRASAFAAQAIDNVEKTQHYVEKAMKIRSDDPMLLSLSQSLALDASLAADEPILTPSHSSSEIAATPMEEIAEIVAESPACHLSSLPSNDNDKLEERIRLHQSTHETMISDYIDLAKKRSPLQDCALSLISGWSSQSTLASPLTTALSKLLNRSVSNKNKSNAPCGFYLRWNGTGIVINPGEGFLEQFHEQGFHLHDIDVVIATNHLPQTYADITRIYQLNAQLNHVSPELHLIHYYLNQTCFQDLSRVLKPHFKQERYAIHCLELFLDSPEIERIDLAPDMVLHYFPSQHRGAFDFSERLSFESQPFHYPSLGIVLELTAANQTSTRIGYLSGASWSPLLADHLGRCDILVAGFGQTQHQDYHRVSYQEGCLGYNGTASLIADLKPRLCLCTEFSGLEGDIRLEVVRKLRKECQEESGSVAILPADKGLHLHLASMKIQCSISSQWLDPNAIRVIKTADSFGELCYVSSEHCL